MYGPDYNLPFAPTAHGNFTIPNGKKGHISIWGDGANEQGLMLYRPDGTALAVMRTPPGVDDQYGAELRAGTRLLTAGSYMFGGYCKVNFGSSTSPDVKWTNSRIKTWEASPAKIVFGWDDVIGLSANGIPVSDNDFNDLMVAIEFV